jgi:hypothetical protein
MSNENSDQSMDESIKQFKEYIDNYDGSDVISTIKELVGYVEETKDFAEFPHLYEDMVYHIALDAIADGKHAGFSPQEVAREALKVRDIKYERGYLRFIFKDLWEVAYGLFWAKVKRNKLTKKIMAAVQKELEDRKTGEYK